jgi:DNA-binding NarL/FixJ family response regulator
LSNPIRILIADDHEMVRHGLRSLLEQREGWTVCGEAADGRTAVSQAETLRPHIVIMDVSMPELNGLEATRMIRKAIPNCEVLILSMHHSEQLVREVLAVGARSYMLKSDAGELLINAIENLARGKPFFSPQVSEVILNAFLEHSGDEEGGRSDAGPLTAREREVIQLIAEGKSSKEIATVLGLSEKTVETHRSNLMRKLDIHSVSEIVRYAIRNQIIEA